jgi:DNA-binding beta-propeller fold protein YncE
MTIQAVSAPTYTYSHTIGNQATPPAHGFSAPVDVALGQNGLLYVVCDYYEYPPTSKFIVKCTIDEEYLGAFGSYGAGDGQFTWPNSIAVDKEGNVYLTDEWLHRISVYDSDGKFLRQWGAQGDGEGQWNRPAGIAFDTEDNLLVVDSLNHRIQKFTKGGKFLGQWGGPGSGDGQFNTPWGINLDYKGNVYVADWRNDRIQKFTADGRFLMQIGRSGNGDGEFHRPSGVAVDREGYIYAVDWGHDQVQVFDPEGRFITRFIGDCPGYSKWAKARMASNPESMAEQRALVKDFRPERMFFHPTGIEVDHESRIIVVDCGRHRLQIYQKVAG